MTGAVDCRRLDWDTDFFGCRIARVESRDLDAGGMRGVLDYARREGIDCLYLLLDASDEDSAAIALAGGFRCVDVRVTLERDIDGVEREMPASVDAFREADLCALRSIARTSHGASRFYHDPHFPRERCDALYEAWISKSCRESPEGVLVVRNGEDAVGYLTCDLESQRLGSIGLVAVHESERGKHLGAALVEAALAWFARRGCERVRVVTQERNLVAARLYERFGFDAIARESWYHLWPDREWPDHAGSDRGVPDCAEGA